MLGLRGKCKCISKHRVQDTLIIRELLYSGKYVVQSEVNVELYTVVATDVVGVV